MTCTGTISVASRKKYATPLPQKLDPREPVGGQRAQDQVRATTVVVTTVVFQNHRPNGTR